MIVVNDIHHWAQLGATAVAFPSEKARPCTLDFNAAGKAQIYIQIDGEEKPRFLALVEGRETVKFVTPGAYRVMNKTADVDCYILTRDGELQHRENLDEEAFTTLHEPVGKDPALEAVMVKMNANINRRLKLMEAQYERKLAEQAALDPAPAAAVVTEPVADDGTTQQVPSVSEDSETGEQDGKPV